jgi:hypothetical protein
MSQEFVCERCGESFKTYEEQSFHSLGCGSVTIPLWFWILLGLLGVLIFLLGFS